MRKISIALAVVFSVFFAGCPARSIHPLFTEHEISFNPTLVGKWADGDDLYTFKRSTGNSYEIFLSEQKPVDSTGHNPSSSDTITFIGQLGHIGRNWFLDSYPARELGDFHLLPTHIISRIQFDGDTILIASLEGDWVTKMIKGDRIKAEHTIVDGDIILTGSTSEIQKIIRDFGSDDNAFPNPAKFVRMK